MRVEKLLKAFLILLVIHVAGAASAEDLIVNGGAETGDLTGWPPSGDQIAVVTEYEQSIGTLYPFEGQYFFMFANSMGSYAELVQTFSMTLTPGVQLVLSGFVHTEEMAGDDYGNVEVRVLDAGQSVIASNSTGPLTTANFTWQGFSVGVLIPAGAEGWEVILSGTRRYGSYINVFFDSIQMVEGSVATEAVTWGGVKALYR